LKLAGKNKRLNKKTEVWNENDNVPEDRKKNGNEGKKSCNRLSFTLIERVSKVTQD
jgi:hypothetical protein